MLGTARGMLTVTARRARMLRKLTMRAVIASMEGRGADRTLINENTSKLQNPTRK